MENYSEEEYHQRGLIETGQGAEKRKYSGFTLAINWRTIRNEAYCKAIAYNLRLSSLEISNRTYLFKKDSSQPSQPYLQEIRHLLIFLF